MLAPGTKIPSPHVRATGKNGTIHAVDRATPEGAKSLCGKATVLADLPLRRYQQGLGKECSACTNKVVAARLQAIKDRKALRSAKNVVPIKPAVAPANPVKKPTAPTASKASAASRKVHKAKGRKSATAKSA